MKINGSEIEPLSVNFTFDVSLLPLEIIFINLTESMLWDDNKLLLKSNCIEEKDIL